MNEILAGAFMAATRTEGFAPEFAPQDGSARGLFRRLRAWTLARRQRAAEIRTARDVYLMDDALLRDIGLTRADAERLALTGRLDRAAV